MSKSRGIGAERIRKGILNIVSVFKNGEHVASHRRASFGQRFLQPAEETLLTLRAKWTRRLRHLAATKIRERVPVKSAHALIDQQATGESLEARG